MIKLSRLSIVYIYLAVATAAFGSVLTVVVVLGAAYFGLDLYRNLWLLAIPLVFSLVLNICLIELYFKFWDK